MHTRESLLADWQAISPSHPLSSEVEELLLEFLNQPRREVLIMDHVDSPESLLLPPLRFERQGKALHGRTAGPRTASFSPGASSERAETISLSLLTAPPGPCNTSIEQRDTDLPVCNRFFPL